MLDLSRARVIALVLAIACTTQPIQAQEPPTGSDGAEQSEAPGTPWDYVRAWSRLHWRWYLLWLERQRAQGATDERCGDGELQEGEQCDDGNLEPDDGCGTRCELADNPGTPGDDRPGFVLCASSTDPSLTCSPEQRCCRSPENVCDTLEQDCQRPDVTVGWGDDCDGPEDCASELTCVRGKYGTSCTPANPQQGYPVLCHVDSDCSFIPETRCGAEGACAKL
jgi:cysteine-rich repeat protein